MRSRSKLRREHIALNFHNMRLKYGDVRRYGAIFTALTSNDVCIDCCWTINIGDRVIRANWLRREISGFYAHEVCSPITDSEWITNRDFSVIISEGEYGNHLCSFHLIQVIGRVLTPDDFTQYICPKCVEETMTE